MPRSRDGDPLLLSLVTTAVVVAVLFLTPSCLKAGDLDPVFAESFDDHPDTPWGALPPGWWIEGEAAGARARIADGRLLVDTTEPRGSTATVWLDRDLPRDVEVSFDVHVVGSIREANNMNLLLHFRDPGATSPFATRAERADGRYAHYHSERLGGTIITFLANGEPENARLRVRMVPPFDPVLHESKGYHARVGQTYRFEIVRQGDRLRVRIDGREVCNTVLPDNPAGSPGGYLGFRTWRTKLWWDNLIVRRPSPTP